jgi:hypothetical protein
MLLAEHWKSPSHSFTYQQIYSCTCSTSPTLPYLKPATNLALPRSRTPATSRTRKPFPCDKISSPSSILLPVPPAVAASSRLTAPRHREQQQEQQHPLVLQLRVRQHLWSKFNPTRCFAQIWQYGCSNIRRSTTCSNHSRNTRATNAHGHSSGRHTNALQRV